MYVTLRGRSMIRPWSEKKKVIMDNGYKDRRKKI